MERFTVMIHQNSRFEEWLVLVLIWQMPIFLFWRRTSERCSFFFERLTSDVDDVCVCSGQWLAGQGRPSRPTRPLEVRAGETYCLFRGKICYPSQIWLGFSISEVAFLKYWNGPNQVIENDLLLF